MKGTHQDFMKPHTKVLISVLGICLVAIPVWRFWPSVEDGAASHSAVAADSAHRAEVGSHGRTRHPDAARSETITEEQVDAELRNNSLLSNLTGSELTRMRAAVRKSLEMQRDAGTQVLSEREQLTAPSHTKAMTDQATVEAFLKARPTVGAYIAAAGVSRDAAWLDKGLLSFPNDAALLKAKAMMNHQYLRSPSLIDDLRRADPGSGWPDLLAADVAVGQNRMDAAYAAVSAAAANNLGYTMPAAEIKELLDMIGVRGNVPQFWDIGDNGRRTVERVASELADAARQGHQNAAADSSWTYSAAAALGLYDVMSDLQYSDEAGSAAGNSMRMLELLGEERAADFLGGQSYAAAMQYYSSLVSAADESRRNAQNYRDSLPSKEAQASFESLWNSHGARQALELAQGLKK